MNTIKKIATILLTIFVCAQTSAQKSTLHGRILGLANTEGLVVYRVTEKNTTETIDTIKVKNNGNYNITVECAKPTMFFLTISEKTDSPVIHAMLLPQEKVELDMEYNTSHNSITITSTKGSDNLSVYKSFNNIIHGSLDELKAIDNEYVQPSTTDARKRELADKFQEIQTSQYQQIKTLLENNTSVLVSAFLVTYFDNDFSNSIKLYESIRNGLIKKYPDNNFVKHIDERLSQNIGIGSIAPEIVMSNPDGKTCKLSDLRGKIVLIDFWASWCAPCRAENPNVVRLYKKYNEKGFDVFSISLDKNKDQWTNAILKDGLIWPNHVSELKGWTSSAGKRYGVNSIPHTLLIDQEGRIIAKNLRGKELENKLKELFGF